MKHKDFSDKVIGDLPLSHMPFSILLPLHGSCMFISYPVEEAVYSTQVWFVPFGHYLHFRGDLMHAGGQNLTDSTHFRIHCYFAPNSMLIPSNEVYTTEE